ncbi:MAG: protein-disulfide reductase DsbD [Pseudomonadales bacterium]
MDEAYQVIILPADDELQLSWSIAEDYYLYRHQFAVKIEGVDRTHDLQIEPGLAKTDEYFGDVEVFYNNANMVISGLNGSKRIRLELKSQGCADAGLCYPPRKQWFDIDLSTNLITELPDPSRPKIESPAKKDQNMGLWLAAALAFAGGIILNLMPCVLPILTLKVLGFAQAPANSLRSHGWFYAAGVISSFVLIAAILITLKAAGQAIGWGFQLQAPWFVAALTYLFFVLALSLMGLLELGNRFMGIGQKLTEKSGHTGSFFTGVLATTVASPCTAPFMGSALGFAMTQSWLAALIIFAFLGAGMAFPFVLLSHLPKLGRWLPQPGLWMERFKQAMAFPLLATAIWLLSVLSGQTGTSGVSLVLVGCLLLALAAWWPTGKSSRLSKPLLLAIVLASLLHPSLSTSHDDQPGADSFQREQITRLRNEGHSVFVNVTADWCITCIANERLVLGTETTAKAFDDKGVVYIKADWTRYNPAISALLEEYGRSGIPLYLLYPADPDRPALMLPQLLTQTNVAAALAEL